MSSGGTSPAGGGGAPSGAAGGDLGGTYPNPTVDLASGGAITGAVTIHPPTDVVSLAITAAAANSSNLLEVGPDSGLSTLAIDRGGRFLQPKFTFIASSAIGSSSLSLPAGQGYQVDNDDTGDFLIRAVAHATDNKLGFFNKTPAAQPTAVADAVGGAIIDDEARTALNALLARVRTLGLIAT